MKDTHNNLIVEPHIVENTINPDRIFRRTLDTAGLLEFVTCQPTIILPIAVAEFNLHLEGRSIETSITNPSTGKVATINLFDVAEVFHLFNEGPDPESAGVEIEAVQTLHGGSQRCIENQPQCSPSSATLSIQPLCEAVHKNHSEPHRRPLWNHRGQDICRIYHLQHC